MSEIDPKQLYHDYEYLAHGGFSTVYKAKNEAGKEIAIKKIPFKEYTMIQRELSLLKQCKSKYVIKVLNEHSMETEKEFWIVLEYCSGGSIEKIAGHCTENKLRKIIKDALNGLQYLHSKQIIHRDIKPENILYHKETNTYKLGDFGCGKNTQISTAKTSVGTSCYKAPEMLTEGKIGCKVDVWSLGVTIYFLATNDYPFNSKNQLQLMLAISQGNVIKLTNKKDKIFTQHIKNFVNDKCLLKDPKHRDSADKLLKHPWIIQEQKDEIKEETQEEIQKLRNEMRLLKASEQKYQQEMQKIQNENSLQNLKLKQQQTAMQDLQNENCKLQNQLKGITKQKEEIHKNLQNEKQKRKEIEKKEEKKLKIIYILFFVLFIFVGFLWKKQFENMYNENVNSKLVVAKDQHIRLPSGSHKFDVIIIEENGILTTTEWIGNGSNSSGGMLILEAQSIILKSQARLHVNGLGYKGGKAEYQGESVSSKGQKSRDANEGGGGGYSGGGGGGYGTKGNDGNGGKGGHIYGNINIDKLYLGSGGGAGYYDSSVGGNGGGALRIIAMNINIGSKASIEANGSDGGVDGGGGSGGSIYITAKTMKNSGSITAVGGKGGEYGGNGGYGRIRIDTNDIDKIGGTIKPNVGYSEKY